MIVISGALVLVALVLLILGALVLQNLDLVYASIVISLISGVFLGIGILQRRGEPREVPEPANAAPTGASASQPAPAAAVPAAAAAAPGRGGSVAVLDKPPSDEQQPDEQQPDEQQPDEQQPDEQQPDEPPAAAGNDDDDYYDDEDIDPADDRAVLVVEGRPRYHALGCRYLSGRQSETIHLLDAREEGFTPCGVCKPDNVIAVEDDLAVVPAEEGVEPVVDVYDPAVEEGAVEDATAEDATDEDATDEDATDEDAIDEDAIDEDATDEDAALEQPAEDDVGVGSEPDAPTTAFEPQPELVDASLARARRAPARRAGSSATATADGAATAAGPRETAASEGRRAGSVVVIPDRGKFHKAECRYVRGVAGAEVRSKTQATKQGYSACGVCKP